MTKCLGLAVAGIVCACAVALSAAPAAFNEAGPGQLPGAHTPLGRLISGSLGRLLVLQADLNLTDAQRQEIRTVLVKHRPEIAATVKSVRDCRVELRDAVLRGESDEATIKTAGHKLGDAIADAAVKATKLRNEVAPILTSEQRERIGQFFSEQDGTVNKFLERAVQSQ
jgi:Spy/CpxP family protein refolding chaperone